MVGANSSYLRESKKRYSSGAMAEIRQMFDAKAIANSRYVDESNVYAKAESIVDILLEPEKSVEYIEAGGIYSCRSRSKYCIVRVLVIENGVVHVGLYSSSYATRPIEIGPDALQVKIGHTPISMEMFADWEPEFLVHIPVSDSELAGFHLWKMAMSQE